jgi:hypothetical protein
MGEQVGGLGEPRETRANDAFAIGLSCQSLF